MVELGRWARIGCVVVVALAVSSWSANAVAAPLSGDELLTRLTDPAEAAASLPVGARVVQRSSHEREGGNRDWGVWSDREGRPQTYVRREPGGFVLLDERRPGCLTRMWFTTGPVAVTEIANIGQLQLFFDGEAEPRVDVPAGDFFAGRVPGYPAPLVGNADSSSGGHYSYVPFCFKRSLKVRITAMPENEQVWYQLTELVLPHGSPVRSFQPGVLKTDSAVAALAKAGTPPVGDPVVAEKLLNPGDRLALIDRAGAGSIRFMRFAVTPFTPEVLGGLELRVTADGAKAAQIVAPLGAVLGDGLSARSIGALAFGMDPVAGRGYFALPVPFGRGVSAELIARTPARVRAETWVGPKLAGADRLHGRQWVEHSQRGTDFTALAAPASGRLAAWVLDLIGPPGSDMGPVQFFLEGDERVHVDGSPSPTIYGTGTEDAFNGGFYYSRGAFSLPTHGAGLPISRGDTRGARSQYRVFGADGFLWEDGIRFGMEHGGGDEHDDEITASTAFWYASAARLRKTDALRPANRRSRSHHRLRGSFTRTRLTAYFEGERDGNAMDSPDFQFGGTAYPAPPPEESPEAVTANGIAFSKPLSFSLATGGRNCGVIVRRRLDAAQLGSVTVAVDGRRVGTWAIAEANPAKRWLSDDFQIHPRHTVGKRRVHVTLSPTPQTTATAFSIQALARRTASCATRSRAKRSA